MKAMYSLLLTCVAFGCRTAASVPGDLRQDNGDLVNAIKLNLRKNNDDYTDTPDLKTVKSTTSSYSKNKIQNLRRADKYVDSEIFDKVKKFKNINSTNEYRRNQLENWKITPFDVDTKPTQSQHTITTQMQSFQGTNDSKIVKFNNLLQRNTDSFKDFVSSKLASGTKSTGMKGFGRKADSNKEWSEEDNGSRKPFDPDRLDMLPAIGGRIHYWRIQGRLCHRQVVMPEGPKYDSKGRVYLPAHSARRPYNVTRSPKLLLPKCCNCCKKSVLGCE